MPTIAEVIALVDEIKPNAFSEEAKTAWINECEGVVQTEIFLRAVEEIITYQYSKDKDKKLLVKPPHDKIYWAYLSAMIDFANGEYNKYENTMAVYNKFLGEFSLWFAHNYRPADTREDVYLDEYLELRRGSRIGEPWRGYYVSAYGLAVLHGFTGTEEEWVQSLHGKTGGYYVPALLDGVLRWTAVGEEDMPDVAPMDIRGPTGAPGGYYVPVITEDGVLTFAPSKSGMPIIPSVNIKGPPGETGKSAYQIAVEGGYTGTEAEWLVSLQGTPGTDGTNGTDGGYYAPFVSQDGTLTFTASKGHMPIIPSANIKGAQGKSAYQIAVDGGYTGTEAAWIASLKGLPGEEGHTPVKGVDYFTESEKADMVAAVLTALPNGDEVSY